MKRAGVIAGLLVLTLVLLVSRRGKEAGREPARATRGTEARPAPAASGDTPSPADDGRRAAARADIREIAGRLSGFLLVLKDPYRPPLGDNEDITRALTGGNRRGFAAFADDDPRIVAGRLVDPWGTPYWFHARAPDAIDIVSAGPDRALFTADDIAADDHPPRMPRF